MISFDQIKLSKHQVNDVLVHHCIKTEIPYLERSEVSFILLSNYKRPQCAFASKTTQRLNAEVVETYFNNNIDHDKNEY